MIELNAGAKTDVGLVRQVNQDDMISAPGLYVVADGMGGHRGGEVASAIAVEVLAKGVRDNSLTTLIDAVQGANDAILARAANEPGLAGMGTTLCAMAVIGDPTPNKLGIVNVGDSRVYRYWDDELAQVTEDHSLVETLYREGRLTREEVETHPQRNIVTRALGIEPGVEVDRWLLPARVGERFVLCSDGLTNEVTNNEIGATLRNLADPQQVAEELVRRARDRGARDNVTVVVVDVVGHGETVGPVTEQTPAVPLAVPPNSPGVDAPRDMAGFSVAVEPSDNDPAVTDLAASPTSGPPELPEPDLQKPPRARATAGGVVFVLVVLAVVASAFAITRWYATSNYFLDFESDSPSAEIVVFRGRPGGVLVWDPAVEERSGLFREDFTPVDVETIERNPEFGSLDEALEEVDRLRRVANDLRQATEAADPPDS